MAEMGKTGAPPPTPALPTTGSSSPSMGVIIAIIAVVVSTILLFLLLKKRVQQRSVLFLGLCDSGKTLLLSHIGYNTYKNTQTSIKPNEATYSPDGKRRLELVDIPGHERLRQTALDRYKAGTRGLLFVVDSTTVQKQLKDVAEYLYTVLTDPAVAALRPPLLVLCNKQDQMQAKGASLIRTQLEREINTLRWTKSSSLQGTDDSSTTATLGREGEDFEFSHLRQPVEFVEGSCGANEDDEPSLEAVTEWLNMLA
ncbi:signal recognition particle receptor subunit beta-like [Amphibalanus amphitrite]|uniref:signal recognition particle receptor subunit beta-like n=1 Tax=Amphibalanus amphitrite TaxID=1232801 RepID=UPI001C90E4A1|nr:signal recognition particle receptor subunit beta-like [Amphibalanus amphitrite]